MLQVQQIYIEKKRIKKKQYVGNIQPTYWLRCRMNQWLLPGSRCRFTVSGCTLYPVSLQWYWKKYINHRPQWGKKTNLMICTFPWYAVNLEVRVSKVTASTYFCPGCTKVVCSNVVHTVPCEPLPSVFTPADIFSQPSHCCQWRK